MRDPASDNPSHDSDPRANPEVLWRASPRRPKQAQTNVAVRARRSAHPDLHTPGPEPAPHQRHTLNGTASYLRGQTLSRGEPRAEQPRRARIQNMASCGFRSLGRRPLGTLLDHGELEVALHHLLPVHVALACGTQPERDGQTRRRRVSQYGAWEAWAAAKRRWAPS